MADGSDRSELAKLAAELDAVVRYADAQEQKVRQLEVALESRVVIEQAVGMLAERFDLTVAHAFDLLRKAARNSRRELRALAFEVTLSRITPVDVAAVRGKA